MIPFLDVGKREFAHPEVSLPLTSLSCPPCRRRSLELSEPEQCLAEIKKLLELFPKPNHDTLQYVLEHLCRSGRHSTASSCRGGWSGRAVCGGSDQAAPWRRGTPTWVQACG